MSWKSITSNKLFTSDGPCALDCVCIGYHNNQFRKMVHNMQTIFRVQLIICKL